MCKETWENWLERHKPDNATISDIGAKSIEAILTMRLDTITIEELTDNFHYISKEQAEAICYRANSIISEIEECLLDSIK